MGRTVEFKMGGGIELKAVSMGAMGSKHFTTLRENQDDLCGFPPAGEYYCSERVGHVQRHAHP